MKRTVLVVTASVALALGWLLRPALAPRVSLAQTSAPTVAPSISLRRTDDSQAAHRVEATRKFWDGPVPDWKHSLHTGADLLQLPVRSPFSLSNVRVIAHALPLLPASSHPMATRSVSASTGLKHPVASSHPTATRSVLASTGLEHPVTALASLGDVR